MAKKEVNLSSEERLGNLREQLEEITTKREQLVAELNALNTISLKLQGAIEILDSIEKEKGEKN